MAKEILGSRGQVFSCPSTDKDARFHNTVIHFDLKTLAIVYGNGNPTSCTLVLGMPVLILLKSPCQTLLHKKQLQSQPRPLLQPELWLQSPGDGVWGRVWVWDEERVHWGLSPLPCTQAQSQHDHLQSGDTRLSARGTSQWDKGQYLFLQLASHLATIMSIKSFIKWISQCGKESNMPFLEEAV